MTVLKLFATLKDFGYRFIVTPLVCLLWATVALGALIAAGFLWIIETLQKKRPRHSSVWR